MNWETLRVYIILGRLVRLQQAKLDLVYTPRPPWEPKK